MITRWPAAAEIAAPVLPSVVQIEVKGADGEGTGSDRDR
jgi:hypothetical protein